MTDSEDTRTLDDLRPVAADLNIEGRSTMTRDELAAAVDEAQAAAGVTGGTGTTVPQADAPIATPNTVAVAADPEAAPASPDDPTDGRPPLLDVAQDAAANTNVRVIGAGEEE